MIKNNLKSMPSETWFHIELEFQIITFLNYSYAPNTLVPYSSMNNSVYLRRKSEISVL